MTRPEHPDEHLELETIAELAGGALEEPWAAAAREHLAACRRCQQGAADVAAVRRLLAAEPAATMPPDVARRIEAALAAAPGDGDALVPLLAPRDGEQSPDGASRGASPQAVPGAASQAASQQGASGAASRETPERPPGASVPAPVAPRRAGGGHARLVAAAAAVLVLLVGGLASARVLLGDGGVEGSAGSAPVSTAREDGSPRTTAVAPERAGGVLPVVASGTRYSRGELARQAVRLAARPIGERLGAGNGARDSADPADPAVTRAAPPALRPFADPERLRDCLARATGAAPARPSVRPLAVDLAWYGAKPAAVVVAAGSAPDTLEVWVLGAACSAERPDILRHTTVKAR